MNQQRDVAAGDRELAIALKALDNVQLSIRRADTKAAGLAGLQLSVVTIALGRAGAAAQVWGAGGESRIVPIVLAVMMVGGLAASLALLGAVIWPRMAGASDTNLFGFPALAARAEPPRTGLIMAVDDAWEVAMQLARTAEHKYKLIRLAMYPMAASTVALIGWLCLIGTSQ